jgi:hypothetical protein
MTEAAAAWLHVLDAPQREKATFPFDDETQRTDWAYFPRNHAGLPLHEMDIRQQKLAHALLTSALSVHAYAKVTAIMALESVLNLLEQRRADGVRDPGRYFFSMFGSPADVRWGWRCEGHHVSLNFTIVDGRVVSPTPIFLGANPAEVRRGAHAITRPCAEEEDVARELLASLDTARRETAILCDVAPPDFVLANLPSVPQAAMPGDAVPPFMRSVKEIREAWEAFPAEAAHALRFERTTPLGLAARDMAGAQRALLSELIDVYISRLPDDLASIEREKIERAGIGDVHFAWAGPAKRGEGHYYRLQGESFLVEYDNTQDGANHVHAVWRDMANDFGMDALRGHLRGAH